MATIIGTKANDILDGTSDKDFINGLTGADTMSGGTNDDIYFVDNAKDKVVELANAGHDIVLSTINVAKLWDNVEDLTLGNIAVSGTGNDLSNVITGNDKNNVLDGGTNSDLLIGGKGNDIYIVDHVSDTVTEQNGEGTDLIKSSITFTASGWVEGLSLTGSANIDALGNNLNNVLTGNVGNNTLDGGVGQDTMSGGKGNDIYYVDNDGDVVVESAGQGIDRVVSDRFSTTLSANVEELVLIGGFQGIGNALDNVLIGHDFANYLDGGKGADKMAGGKQADGYAIDNADDEIVELAGEGEDYANSTVTIDTLWDNVEVVYLKGNAALNVTGNELDNHLNGNIGKNVIDGGVGKDTMTGDLGNDTYIVDNAGDTVVEEKGEGVDLIKSSVGYSLSDNVENLILTGKDNISGFGNGLDNVLTGNDGGNFLNGGVGKDTMIGGKGSDQYAVDNVGDKIVETLSNAKDGGKDSVYSSVDFSLATLANVDNIYLNGNAHNATGNALDNILEGTAGSNVLQGGKGADAMTGFDGWDLYYVDNIGDKVTEQADGGTDRIISSIAFSDAVANVERYEFHTSADVIFTGTGADNQIFGGSGDDSLSGAAGNDNLKGNDGDDTLSGGTGNDDLLGGKGADDLSGGTGNDYYEVDNVKDKVTEGSNEGDSDFVESSVSLAHLFDNVEDATLVGTGSINLTGNGLDNHLTGNGAKNTIDGGLGQDEINGQRGNDILIGGGAADTFAFDIHPKGGANDGHDTIKDFVKAEDILSFVNVDDANNDGMIKLDDLIASTSVFDHGAGKDVDVTFDNGAVISFTGVGTGSIDSIVELVGTTNQIEVA